MGKNDIKKEKQEGTIGAIPTTLSTFWTDETVATGSSSSYAKIGPMYGADGAKITFSTKTYNGGLPTPSTPAWQPETMEEYIAGPPKQ